MKADLGILCAAALVALSNEGHAAPPAVSLTTFTAGTTAKAADVNGNFSAVKAALNGNDSRITALEGNAANPDITGNITLVPSTATAGNILKGIAPFIHNIGVDNTFIGVSAGNLATTGSGQNTGIGASALFNNTTGFNNTASGASALLSNTAGNNNTASGAGALQKSTTGIFNTASGASALLNNTTGGGNTASGTSSLLNNNGNNNTASGLSAMQNNTTGSGNTASGVGALQSNTTGFVNVAVGFHAGINLTTGSDNIAIANDGVAGDSATTRIGSAQTRAFMAGIRGITTANANAVGVLIDSAGQLGTVNSSRGVKDDITDMGGASRVLMKLRPVTFHYKNDKNPNGRTRQYGLVAEEVVNVAPGLVARSADGKIETVYYQFLAPMLLNEYQIQQRTIEAQARALAEQSTHIAELKRERFAQATRIEALEKRASEIAATSEQVQRTAQRLEALEHLVPFSTASR